MTRLTWALVVWLMAHSAAAAGAQTVLRIRVTLRDGAQATVPVARHVLLVSDNPATREPRRIVTGADGTVNVTLPSGSYTVESDRPVMFLGAGYQWTQFVEVMGGQATLELNAANAEAVPLTDVPPDAAPGARGDPAAKTAAWHESVVTVWTPTSRATGIVVDTTGLIVTDAVAVGRAATVEVQVSATVKVAGRVIQASGTAAAPVAVVQIDSSAIAGRTPVPVSCQTAGSSLEDRQELAAVVALLPAPAERVEGDVTVLSPRSVETNMRLPFGGGGAPVFNEAGTLVGVTSLPVPIDGRRGREVNVVRVGPVCEAMANARAAAGGPAPSATPLPLEPARGFPAEALQAAAAPGSVPLDPPVANSDDFDVAFITPLAVARASVRADWTGGRSSRTPEAEARIGRLTEFGALADYFSAVPPVLAIRVTPQLVEGFWKRLAREAARTQGAELPAFKDFSSSFVRMTVSCGGTEVVPVHPFVIEHRVSDKQVVREGLYVFDPEAIGPHCKSLSLSLYSEKAPAKADTVTISPAMLERISHDFAAYRAATQP